VILDSSLSPLEGWAPLSKVMVLCYNDEVKILGKGDVKLTVDAGAGRRLPNGNKLYRLVLGDLVALECINVVSAATGRRYPVVRRETSRGLNIPKALPPVYPDAGGILPPAPETPPAGVAGAGAGAKSPPAPAASRGWSFW
jgi:hypothetical protein